MFEKSNKQYSICIILFVFCFVFEIALAESSRSIRLQVEVLEKSPNIPQYIKGRMSFDSKSIAKNGACLFLSLNDKKFGSLRRVTRRFDLMSEASRPVYRNGNISVESIVQKSLTGDLESTVEWEQLSPSLIKIYPKEKQYLEITFLSKIPRLKNSNSDFWFYDEFYPQLLTKCPDAEDPRFLVALDQNFHLSIEKNENWQTIGTFSKSLTAKSQQLLSQEEIKVRGKKVAFAFVRGYKQKRVEIQGIVVDIFYVSKDFMKVLSTLQGVLKSHIKWLGEFPHEKLTILETSELEDPSIPGLLTFNRPRQQISQYFQKDVVNWQHWVLTSLLALQWINLTQPNSLDDLWLIDGTVDFVTLQALLSFKERYNLFNVMADSMQFNYLQFMEITAALLDKKKSESLLTDLKMKSIPSGRQHSLGFVKHTFALRHLNALSEHKAFAPILQSLLRSFRYQRITPRKFQKHLLQANSQKLADTLKEWWMRPGWPDYNIKNLSISQLAEDRWQTTAEVEIISSHRLPISITLADNAGNIFTVRRGHQDILKPLVITTKFEPQQLYVDGMKEIYDRDRFNNSNLVPDIKFFPGSAATISDRDYMVLWLPSVAKLPGEGVSLSVKAHIYRYITNNITGKLDYQPAEKKGAFSLKYQRKMKNLSLRMSGSRSYDNHRIVGFGSDKKIYSGLFGDVGASIDIENHRSDDNKQYYTGRIGIASKFKYGSECSFRVSLNTEDTITKQQKINYHRRYTSDQIDCKVGDVRLTNHLFWGEVEYSGKLPSAAGYLPTNLSEARLRLNKMDLPVASLIRSFGLDVFFPFYLYIPDDLMVLSRNLYLNLFYDIGNGRRVDPDESIDNRKAPDRLFHYRAGGFGFTLPFGGDLSGIGSLTMTKVTMLVGVYNRYNDNSESKPYVLFDYSGKL